MPSDATKDAPKPDLIITSFLLEPKASAIREIYHPPNRIVERGLTAALLQDMYPTAGIT